MLLHVTFKYINKEIIYCVEIKFDKICDDTNISQVTRSFHLKVCYVLINLTFYFNWYH